MRKSPCEIQSEGIFKHIFFAFVLALLGYVFFYGLDRHLRLHKGPWELTFRVQADGTPMLIIHQSALGIDGVMLRFEGEIAQTFEGKVAFEGPNSQVPFGKIIFFDTTYLPGTLTLDIFGHKVEMMKRALVLNFQEHTWQSGKVISLLPNEKWNEKSVK